MTVTTNLIQEFGAGAIPGLARDVVRLSDTSFGVLTQLGGVTTLTTFTNLGNDAPVSFTVGGVGQSPSMAVLSNNNIVIASHDADSIVYTIVTQAGAVVKPTTDINDSPSAFAKVVALDGGGFVIANEQAFTLPDYDVEFRRFDNSGSLLGSAGNNIDTSVVAVDRSIDIAAIAGGGFAATWTRTANSETEIWYAVYSATGTPVKTPTLYDSTGTIARNSSITRVDAGFAIAYESNNGAPDGVVRMATFTGPGALIATQAINLAGADEGPQLAQLSNGYLQLAFQSAFGNGNIIIQVRTPGLTLVPSADYSLTVSPDPSSDTEISPLVAALGNGRDVIVYSNTTTGTARVAVLHPARTSTSDGAGDTINGDDIRDIMNGNDGADTLNGGAGNDTMDGGTGTDTLLGGNDQDFLFGGEGNDVLAGQAGDDLLGGWTGVDWMEGGDGNDWLSGGDGNDRLEGGAGRDFLEGQGGIDAAFGGAGDDFYVVDETLDDVFENAGEGNDTVYASVNWGIRANVENLTLIGTNAIGAYGDNAANVLVGNEAANAMGGFGGNDWIEANGGNDWISGGDGADRLDGGTGNDVLEGQLGADLLIGGLGADAFLFSSALDSNFTSGFDSINGFEHGIDHLVVARQSAADTFSFTAFNGSTIFQVDFGGDGTQDLVALVVGVTNLTNADVILA